MTRAQDWLPCAIALSGCSIASDPRVLHDGCELGAEARVADGMSPDPHDIAVTRDGVFVSNPHGLFVIDGTARTRLGPPCDGGLAATDRWLACSRRGDDAHADEGGVVVLRDGLPFATLGAVGPDGDGVAIAASPHRLVVAWSAARTHDGAVWASEVDPETAATTPGRQVSRLGRRAGRPAVWIDATGVADFVWAETWPGERGRPEGALLLRHGEASPQVLEPLAWDRANPTIAATSRGAVVVFRDRRPARSRPRLFLRRLDAQGVAEGVHANASDEAFVVECQSALTAIAPRTHAREEALVAVRRHALDTLEGIGPEHQVYAHAREYEQAAARCTSEGLELWLTTRGTSEEPQGAVRRVTFACRTPPTRE